MTITRCTCRDDTANDPTCPLHGEAGPPPRHERADEYTGTHEIVTLQRTAAKASPRPGWLMRWDDVVTPRAYPGRDKRRILRRAKSLANLEREHFNMRANCCRKPSHVEVMDAAVFTTRCRNCGATV